jgi:hypothetical protein
LAETSMTGARGVASPEKSQRGTATERQSLSAEQAAEPDKVGVGGPQKRGAALPR